MNLQQIKKILNNKAEEVFSRLGMKCEVFGDNIYSTCPIHESSDNPRAFSFSKSKGIWKCWTRECQHEHKNDIIGLISATLCVSNGSEVDFKDVLLWIKNEFGISTNNKSLKDKPVTEIEDDFGKMIQILQEDISFPKPQNIQLDIKITTPSQYFMNRGFDRSTLEYFGVGDCLDKTSKLYERSLIPIHDDFGTSTIGYICRSTKEYKIPKFLIYPTGFDKRFHFYNLHRAIESAKKSNTLFIVEGQGDVWRLYESGIHNAVGMFGKTLSKEQERKLQQLPLTHVVILTDNDQAGRESKIQLQRQLGRFYKLTFPKLNQKDIGEMTIKQIQEDILSQIRC